MEINKGLQVTGFPYKTEDGSWIRAINAILNDDAKSVSNERGMLSIKEDDYFFLGSIQADDGLFLLEQKLNPPYPSSNNKFRISYYDLTNNTFTTILDTEYITYDITNSVNVLEGEFTYNKNNDRIISWSGGKLFDSTDLLNVGIEDRNFCILNVDTLPFVHGLTPAFEIKGHDDSNGNNEHLVLFQNPTIKIPLYTLNDIVQGGGILKSGVHYVGIRYKYPDGDTTNVLHFTKPISIIPGSKVNDHRAVDGGAGNETTGKSINLHIDNLDNRYIDFEVVVYSIIEGVHQAYVDNANTLPFFDASPAQSGIISLDILVTGLNFVEIDTDEVLIDTVYLNNTISVNQFQNQLLLANIEEDEVIDLQKWALDIETEWVYEDWISLDGRKGSYKDELTIYNLKGFMPGETYAFYMTGILTNGKRLPPVHIPGREVREANPGSGYLENALVADETYGNTDPSAAVTVNENFRFYHCYTPLAQSNDMSYWENQDEVYPNEADRFVSPMTLLDLQGEKVRHHKFPEQYYVAGTYHQYTYPYSSLPLAPSDISETITITPNGMGSGSDDWSWETGTPADPADWVGYNNLTYSANNPSNLINVSSVKEIGAVYTDESGSTDPTGTPTTYCRNILIEAVEYVEIDLDYNLVTAGISPAAFNPVTFDTSNAEIVFKVTIQKRNSTANWCTAYGTLNAPPNISAETNCWSSWNDNTDIKNYHETEEISGTVSSITLSPGEAIMIIVSASAGIKDTVTNQNDFSSALSTTVNNALDSATNRVIATITKLDTSIGTGSIFGKVLGIKFKNINIPAEYKNKLQAVEFFYAKRTIETATRICDVGMIDDGTNSRDVGVAMGDDIKVHPFDLYQNGMKNIPLSYIMPHGNALTANTSLVWDASDVHYCNAYDEPMAITNIVFRPGGNSLVVPSNSQQEENVYIKKRKIIRWTGEVVFPDLTVGALSTFRENMYLPFDKQDIVSTGKIVLMSDFVEHVSGEYYYYASTGNVYGGDTFFNMQGTYIAKPGVTTSVAMYVPVHSMSNIALRQGDDIEDIYYRRNEADGLSKLAALLGGIPAADFAKVPLNWKYNEDYSALNDVKMPFPYSTSYLYLSAHGYRIVRSQSQSVETTDLKWRDLRPADYYEMPKDKGTIVSMGVVGNTLVINMKNTTFVAKIKDVLKGANDGVDTYLGKGDLFDREPIEIMTSKNGYAGCSNSNATLETRIGYVFVDTTRYKIFLFDGKELIELSNIHTKALWDIALKNHNVGDDILHNDGISIAYDEENERLLFTIQVYDDVERKTKTVLDRYPTMSFDLGTKRWTGYHSVNVSSFIQGRNRLFSMINTVSNNVGSSKMYEHNRNLYGLYNGSELHEAFSIDIVFNENETIKEIYETIVWETEVHSKSRLGTAPSINDDRNDLLLYDKTFTGIMIYNDTQCSEILVVNNDNAEVNTNTEWYDETEGRNNNGIWSFNNFRDAVLNNKEKFFTYSMGQTTNVDENLKDWQDDSTFISKYLVVRLIFNNVPVLEDDDTITEYKLKFNNVNVGKRKSYK